MTDETAPTPEWVRQARKSLGLTQRELAAVLRMRGASAWQTVSGWEAGSTPVTGPAAVAIELMLSGGRPRSWPGDKA